MNTSTRSLVRMACAAPLAALALACSSNPAPMGADPLGRPAPPTSPSAAASSNGVPSCKLPAPKKSDDACSTDADCAPSVPCHAPMCVAKAKAQPRTPDTVCTMMLECGTADANRCGCFEGRCALIPPQDP